MVWVWAVAASAAWALFIAFVMSLCKAAALGDRQAEQGWDDLQQRRRQGQLDAEEMRLFERWEKEM